MSRKGVPKSPEHKAKLQAVLKRANETRRQQGAHVLTEVNHSVKTARCSVCGPVPIRISKHSNCVKQPEMNGLVHRICSVRSAEAKVNYSGEALEKWHKQ